MDVTKWNAAIAKFLDRGDRGKRPGEALENIAKCLSTLEALAGVEREGFLKWSALDDGHSKYNGDGDPRFVAIEDALLNGQTLVATALVAEAAYVARAEVRETFEALPWSSDEWWTELMHWTGSGYSWELDEDKVVEGLMYAAEGVQRAEEIRRERVTYIAEHESEIALCESCGWWVFLAKPDHLSSCPHSVPEEK